MASTCRRLACAVLITLPLAVCSTARAQEWVRIGTDADGNSYSIDTSRVVHDGSIVSVRVRTEYARPRKVEAADVDVFAALDYMVIDCGKVELCGPVPHVRGGGRHGDSARLNGARGPAFPRGRSGLDVRIDRALRLQAGSRRQVIRRSAVGRARVERDAGDLIATAEVLDVP